MIQLTRLNNSSLLVNSDLIKFVEQSPDTVITLVNGEKILVRETAERVLEQIICFRRAVLQAIYPSPARVCSLDGAGQTSKAVEPLER